MLPFRRGFSFLESPTDCAHQDSTTMTPKLSIVVATHNREAALSRLLKSLQQCSDAVACEVIIANNGSTDGTSKLIRADWRPLTIVPVELDRAGKSTALNQVISRVKGELAVFTDDDVTVPPNWITSYLNGAMTFPNAKILCGPIEPVFFSDCPTWLLDHPYATIMFAAFLPDIATGPLPMRDSPLGPNFAVVASLLKHLRFRTDLGPSRENGGLMCEDTELLERVRSMFFVYNSHAHTVYLSDARTFHNISQGKASAASIADRFFNLGRSHVIRFGCVTHLGNLSILPAIPQPNRGDVLSTLSQINFYLGQHYQFAMAERTLETSFILDLIAQLDPSLCKHFLGTEALQCLDSGLFTNEIDTCRTTRGFGLERAMEDPIWTLPDAWLSPTEHN